jgi:FKBP-type peptidyl-prolyl cis-trans isomerase FklB
MRFVAVAALVLGLLPRASAAEEAADPAEERTRLGYSIGYQVGDDFRRQDIQIDPQLVVRGLVDALEGAAPRLTDDEMRQALTGLQQRATASQEKRRLEQALRNLAEGKAFLAENAEKEGIETLPSGLQIQVLRKGEGDPPGASDTVTVHYRGTLIDGTEFDSSHQRGEPATFPLDGVIAGWSEGLQLMRPGAKLRLFVPSELAYGEAGAGDRIGPHSALVFDVELLSVQRTE